MRGAGRHARFAQVGADGRVGRRASRCRRNDRLVAEQRGPKLAEFNFEALCERARRVPMFGAAYVSAVRRRIGKLRHRGDRWLWSGIILRKRGSALEALRSGTVVDRLALRTGLEVQRRSALV